MPDRESSIQHPPFGLHAFFWNFRAYFSSVNAIIPIMKPALSDTFEKPLTYPEIAESDLFQKFFDLIAGLMGVPVRLMSPEGAMEMRQKFAKKKQLFCDVIRRSSKTNQLCMDCDRSHAALAVKKKSGFAYRCHAGLYDVVAPVFDRETHVATLITGRLLADPHSEKHFQDLWRRFSHPSFTMKELRQAYTDTAFSTEEKVQALAGMLQFFNTHIHEVRLSLKSFSKVKTRLEIAQAQAYVSSHFSEPIYLAEVCRTIGLSPSHFSTVFRKETGIKFFEYVNRVRVDRAKKLLEKTNTSILEIALACGFETASHFNRIFRRIEGRSPAPYRKTVTEPFLKIKKST